jgi:predicted  nucleic acid-binding Zn-ribbon protein
MGMMDTQVRRLEKQIDTYRAKIEDWKKRIAEGGNQAALQSRITNAQRQIEGLQAKIDRMKG